MKINIIEIFNAFSCKNIWWFQKNILSLQPQTRNDGAIAQLVEQRTENPCVPGSIPGGTTAKKQLRNFVTAFFFLSLNHKITLTTIV